MKLAIDLQGVQSPHSHKRGIGRYSFSLLKAIIRQCKHNKIEIVLLVNKNYFFDEYLEIVNLGTKIRLFQPIHGTAHIKQDPKAKELSEEIIQNLLVEEAADALLVLSMFEGMYDETITTTARKIPTYSIFYDAIPKLFPEVYLYRQEMKLWYQDKVNLLKQCAHIFAISETSRLDAINEMEILKEKISTILINSELVDKSNGAVYRDYVQSKPFFFSVLGEDPRKNKKLVFNTISELKKRGFTNFKFVIVYSQSPVEVANNRKIVEELDIIELVEIHNYVSDQDLAYFYKNCEAFVMPSLYEGLGLPILEAISNGAIAIASDVSSMKEIITNSKFRFDPKNHIELAEILIEFLEGLIDKSKIAQEQRDQTVRFNTENAARNLLATISAQRRPKQRAASSRSELAYVSILPNNQSGIADFSLNLLPHLANLGNLTVVTNLNSIDSLTEEKIHSCDIELIDYIDHEKLFRFKGPIIFNIGNSHFHSEELRLFKQRSGTLILHDYFLSGLAWNNSKYGIASDSFLRELIYSEGIGSLFKHPKSSQEIMKEFPMNRRIIEHAEAMVVHSSFTLEKLVMREFTVKQERILKLNMPTRFVLPKIEIERNMEAKTFYCVFGIVSETKAYNEILIAWKNCNLDQSNQLVFIGPLTDEKPVKLSKQLGIDKQVIFTGWASISEYERWLKRAHFAIQLRRDTRGESSQALLDVISHGIPTIVNDYETLDHQLRRLLFVIDREISASNIEQCIRQTQNISKSTAVQKRNNIIRFVESNHSAQTYANELVDLARSAHNTTNSISNFIKRSHELKKKFNLLQGHDYFENLEPPFIKRRILFDVTNAFDENSLTIYRNSKILLMAQILITLQVEVLVEFFYRRETDGCPIQVISDKFLIDSKFEIFEQRLIEFNVSDIIVSEFSQFAFVQKHYKVDTLKAFIETITEIHENL
jgi:glycosyltransferase involved in cell wall biosynthesis